MPCPSAFNGLHLCEAAIHKQFRSRDEAAVVGCEKPTAFAMSSGVPTLASGILLEIVFKRCSPASVECHAGVSVNPGLTAFTRMRRSFKSVVHVRANERMAAFVAYKRSTPATLYWRQWTHSG